MPDKSLRRHTYGEYAERTRRLAAALLKLGLQRGDRVATLSWNHHAHLSATRHSGCGRRDAHAEPAGCRPTRLGWIAADAQDRFLIVDDILLPLYRQFAPLHRFEKVIVFPFSGAKVDAEFIDYEALLGDSRRVGIRLRRSRRERPGGDVLHLGHHRATEGRGLFAPLDDAAHAGGQRSATTGALRNTDVVMPATPMFHANCWGIPYGVVMHGAKLVFPGPHLHPDDLLDLMTLEPPTMSLGVPTIWLSLIQTYERALAEGSTRLEAAHRHALAGRRRCGARVADPRLRAPGASRSSKAGA